MLPYIHNTLIKLRKSKSKICEPNQIDRLLLGGLLLNPDIHTFWNMRRDLVLENSNIKWILYDLHTSKLILSHKPKSNETFNYRSWLLQRMLKMRQFDDMELHSLILEELDLSNSCISKCPNNYHATHNKIQILKLASSLIPSHFEQIIQNELNNSEINMTQAVSDSSVFYYRQHIINHFKENRVRLPDKYYTKIHSLFKNEKLDLNTILGRAPNSKLNSYNLNCLYHTLIILIYEIQFLSALNSTFPCHESIWYHRRYVLWEFMNILYKLYELDIQEDGFFETSTRLQIQDNGVNVTNQVFPTNYLVNKMKYLFFDGILLYKIIEENERKQLDCCSRDSEQVAFVERHKRWFALTFNLPI